MILRLITFAAFATFALAMPALAEDRATTPAEQAQVQDALTKAGYNMINDIQVDDDQFKADAKTKDGKDVEITLDMNTLKVLNVKPN